VNKDEKEMSPFFEDFLNLFLDTLSWLKLNTCYFFNHRWSEFEADMTSNGNYIKTRRCKRCDKLEVR